MPLSKEPGHRRHILLGCEAVTNFLDESLPVSNNIEISGSKRKAKSNYRYSTLINLYTLTGGVFSVRAQKE